MRRRPALSSTTRIVSLPPAPGRFGTSLALGEHHRVEAWQKEPERRPLSGLAMDSDMPARLLHEPEDHGETEPSSLPLPFRGEETARKCG